ncbi:FAD:protein FMN transferase [Microbacterium sp. BK668]|uniref:FAD:protein FMN transferase n=1 Tax=Microbacterium sp. BK668 TaxID=2512118 RepID=UPI00105F96C8|nr:FAD:protein FMN transferase [Microbacterium sp. BK668]TDN92360.1 thiamine biosynthesis lipoprotein [Microbacterium sp. BK668]
MSERAVWSFDAIGTAWEIETRDPLPSSARAAVAGLVADFDAAWSRFRPDSLVSQLAREGGTIPAPRDAAAMLETYAELSGATCDAVNPLVGESLARRGYDATYSFADRGAVAAPTDWRELVRWSSDTLELRAPALLDVGALGKGRLVDLVVETLLPWAGEDLVVDASGDLAARGAVQRVGLEHPYDPARAIGVVEVTDAALCASATNRRAWGDGLHHVLDARTGEPVRAIVATWAIAPTAMRADAAATALFFEGGPELAHAWGVEWVRMTSDGRVEWSPGSKAELFT